MLEKGLASYFEVLSNRNERSHRQEVVGDLISTLWKQNKWPLRDYERKKKRSETWSGELLEREEGIRERHCGSFTWLGLRTRGTRGPGGGSCLWNLFELTRSLVWENEPILLEERRRLGKRKRWSWQSLEPRTSRDILKTKMPFITKLKVPVNSAESGRGMWIASNTPAC